MKKKITLIVTLILLVLMTAGVASAASDSTTTAKQEAALLKAGAEKFWSGFGYDYHYDIFTLTLVSDGSVMIIDCDDNAKGTVTIPATIAGLEVCLGYDSHGYSVSLFSDCKNVKKVVVSEGVEYIGCAVFANNSSIKEIVLPNTITHIYSFAFSECTALKKVNIPDNVIEVGEGCFSGTPIENNDKNWKNGAFYWDGCLIRLSTDVQGKFKVKAGTRLICSGAFTSDEVEEIVFPDSLLGISTNAFQYCSRLNKINIPQNLQYIAEGAFGDYVGIRQIAFSPKNKYFCYENDCLLTKDKKRLIKCAFYAEGNDSVCRIPEGVQVIESYAFSSVNAREVVIPSSVEELKDYAFATSYVKTVALPKSIKKIGDCLFDRSGVYIVDIKCPIKTLPYGIFFHCNFLTEVTLPEGLEVIEGRAFEECNKLTEITLPSTLKRIHKYNVGTEGTFMHGCPQLKNIKIAKGNRFFKLQDGILYNKDLTVLIRCPSEYKATTVTVPATVERIADGAFDGCKNIKKVVLPEGLEFIPDNCFFYCEMLQSVNIPSTVRSIGQNAFANCNLKSITVPQTVKYVHEWYSLGYKWKTDENGWSSVSKVKNFVIKGYAGSPAESYAKEHKISFKAIGKVNKKYDPKYTEDVGSYLKWLPCKSVLKGNVIVLHGAVFKRDVLEMLPHTYFSLEDCNSFSVGQEETVGTGANLVTKDVVEWEFTDWYFVLSGDGNGDGKVNGNDLTRAKKWIGKTVSENDYFALALDLNVNGRIDNRDIAKLEKLTKPTVKTVQLSATSYTYNGKVKTPTVTVKNSDGKTLKKGTDYTVTYAKGRKKVGTYKVTIKFKGNYSGTKTLTFKILPKAASISKLTAKSKAIAVKLNRVTTQSTGYQIQYSTSSKFTSAKTVNVTSYKTSTKTISGLKKGKKYYVRVRTYKTVGKTKCYSAWSSYKTIKTK